MTDPLRWVGPALTDLEAAGLRRHPSHRQEPAGRIARGLVNLSSNDYLDLAGDPRLAAAAADAARRWGVGSGASRLITGGTTLHRELETDIAAWKRVDDTVVFSSGYLANVGTISALADRGDLICSDELNHASIVDACRLSRADVAVFRHRDAEHLDQVLSGPARRRFVVTDGVFSMDGDAADLRTVCAVAEAHDATVVVDDAHGSGVLGPEGRGTVAEQGCAGRVHVTIGTLSKAFGAAGGYAAVRGEVAEWLRNRARSYVFDTAIAPPVVAAALEGLRIARAEPWRRRQATDLARRLADRLGLPAPAACVVPFLVGEPEAALALSRQLTDAGYLAVAIRPPTVPPGTARLRLATMAGHSEADIDGAADALATLTERVQA
jgi:8-amino-7-oxononanoate synthase